MAKTQNGEDAKRTDLEARLVRLALMALFAFILYFVFIGFVFVSALQVIFVLAEDAPNRELKALQARLRAFAAEMLAFLDYSSERRPFPFAPFPEA